MKHFVFFLLVLSLTSALFAQENLPEYRFTAGSWQEINGRLYQNDAKARLAKANIQIPRDPSQFYEFDVRYEAGVEDGQGGFGVHIFSDKIYNGPSWGSGDSYLFWLNYDEKPQTKSIPAGLSAQVYHSRSNTAMDLVTSVDLNEYVPLLTTETLSYPISFRFFIDAASGEVRVYDPADGSGSSYYQFFLEKKDLPLKGNWVALRTNGIKLSFQRK